LIDKFNLAVYYAKGVTKNAIVDKGFKKERNLLIAKMEYTILKS